MMSSIRRKISGFQIVTTPLLYSGKLSEQNQAQVFLKCENLQLTGAYKIRGASHKIMSLAPAQLKLGLVVSSSGNFGQGMALACSIKKVKLIVVVPASTPKIKIQAIKQYGAQIIVQGQDYMVAERLAKKQPI